MVETSPVDIGNETVVENDPKTDLMVKLNEIMENIKELDEILDKFDGIKGNIEYKSLEEKFTKAQIALDGIDSAGIEEVRDKRKSLVDGVEKSLNILESKSKQPEEDIQDFPSIGSFVNEAATLNSPEQINTEVYFFCCILCTYLYA